MICRASRSFLNTAECVDTMCAAEARKESICDRELGRELGDGWTAPLS